MTEIQAYLTKQCQLFQFPNTIWFHILVGVVKQCLHMQVVPPSLLINPGPSDTHYVIGEVFVTKHVVLSVLHVAVYYTHTIVTCIGTRNLPVLCINNRI